MILASLLLSTVVATSCTNCHQTPTIRNDVHATVGLGCHDCHGGNPDPNVDIAEAKNATFVGKPTRVQIPDFCGKCHSSAEYMKRFNPAARVDEVMEYRTSVHGQRLAKGDEKVATCVDCHSVHDIQRKSSPEAPVYATRVAETCGKCHTKQLPQWKVSVHAKAMFEKNDLSAPACNDCHGNHGATPPGVASVTFVCGNCHGREAELFRASTKATGWTQHNELMAGGSKCADCHDDGRSKLTMTSFSDCITCHDNHAVVRPSIAMVGVLPEVPCAFCHEGTGELASLVPEPPKKAGHYRELRDNLLAQAAKLNLTGDARFDWLVDQAENLPTHKNRPEFTRLFEKFRIGKTRYTYGDTTVVIRKCGDCHSTPDAARHYSEATRSLTSMIARAERIQLAAHRGGVETRAAREALDAAIDNQIELETLVHSFAAAPVEKKQQEGLQHARAALLSANTSLEELGYRRRGLLIALAIIIAVLVALGMKMRTL